MTPTLDGLMEVILFAQDMQRQVEFYRDRLGLAVKEPAGLDNYASAYWVEFATGPCTLVLHGGGQRRIGADAPKVVFRVADLEAARAALLARGVELGPSRSPAPGVHVCDGADPEGNHFSLEQRAASPASAG
jgi:catechol 2,3-dioxygenase-like lactoylglutathione lyase family enzyme